MLTTIYVTGLLVSILWLCLSNEVGDPYRRFALSVCWPIMFVYGVMLMIGRGVECAEGINNGTFDPAAYFSDMLKGACSKPCCSDDDDDEKPTKRRKSE